LILARGQGSLLNRFARRHRSETLRAPMSHQDNSHSHFPKSSPHARRKLISEPPFASLDADRSWLQQGIWPASWITHPSRPAAPCSLEFRKTFQISHGQQITIHVSGDESYELLLDGELIGRGSERGDILNWCFDTYEIDLAPGDHCFSASVRAAGPHGLRSQMSVAPAFLLASEWGKINTGKTPWETRIVPSPIYERPFPFDGFSVGWNCRIEAPDETLSSAWSEAHTLHPASSRSTRNRYGRIHLLTPAQLPVAQGDYFQGGTVRHVTTAGLPPLRGDSDLAEERALWERWWKGGRSIPLGPGEQRTILIDLEDYVGAHPEIAASGEGEISVQWAESLFDDPEFRTKGNRGAIDWKYFFVVGEILVLNGGASTFRPPFIRAGRYLVLNLHPTGAPLILESVRLARAEYPLTTVPPPSTTIPALDRLIARCRRTIHASCHDAIIDGPFYEQMQWIGDVCQSALTLYTMSADARLVRKALETFSNARQPEGLLPARWPARDLLIIPGFSLHWITVLRDYALWRDDPAFVASRLPAMRGILDCFLSRVGPDGLLSPPPGWHFTDWATGWPDGIPPRDSDGTSAIAQWHLVWALTLADWLETHFGEPELAQRFRRQATRLADAAEAFWDEEAGAYLDSRSSRSISEHAQTFAVLSGYPDRSRREKMSRVFDGSVAVTRASLAFSHYTFEALRELDMRNQILPRLNEWYDQDASGFLTTPECQEPARSDCHGWSSHPHFHFFATLLGVRPAGPGFGSLSIDPMWEALGDINATLPHPKGEITIRIERGEQERIAIIELPAGLSGTITLSGESVILSEGVNSIRVPGVNAPTVSPGSGHR
jgi:alpha-L-rhamnosidase